MKEDTTISTMGITTMIMTALTVTCRFLRLHT